MKSKRLYIIFGIVILVLLIPLIAMQFTNEVNWSFMDFVIAGILLIGTGVLFEIVFRTIKNGKIKLIVGLIILLLLLLIWAELAVGIFGTPFAGK